MRVPLKKIVASSASNGADTPSCPLCQMLITRASSLNLENSASLSFKFDYGTGRGGPAVLRYTLTSNLDKNGTLGDWSFTLLPSSHPLTGESASDLAGLLSSC